MNRLKKIIYCKSILVIALLFSFSQIKAEEINVILIGGDVNASGMGKVSNLPKGFKLSKDVLFYYSQNLTGGEAAEEWQALCPASETKNNFGVELSLGTYLQNRFVDKKWALIKQTLSGSDIYLQCNPVKQGKEYTKFIQTVKKALQGLKDKGFSPVIRAMVWQHGESDDSAYAENLKNFIGQIRIDLDSRDMLFILDKNKNVQGDLVSQTYLVETNDLQRLSTDYKTADTRDEVHFGTFGVLTLGDRFGSCITEQLCKKGFTIKDISTIKKELIGKEEVAMDNMQNSTVLFTFGQSNSANHGAGLYTPEKEVYNYYKGHLYKAKDPLLGATGTDGSVWGRLADKMIDAGMTKKVTVIPIGFGGSPIAAWVKGGDQYDMFIRTLDEMVTNHVKIDYILWHQGESDNIHKLPKADYIRMFEMIRSEFRSRNINAPIVIAIASYHPWHVDINDGNSIDIRDAQKELAKRYDDIFVGPDTDTLNKAYHRGDGVHFSSRGQDEHATLWLKALKKMK